MCLDKRFTGPRKIAAAVLLLTVFAWCGRLDAATGSLALGGTPGQSSGIYRVTPEGELARISRNGATWQCRNIPTWGTAALGQGSLISGEQRIYGLDVNGQIFNTYMEGQLARFAPLGPVSAVSSLALGGDADSNTGVYGVDSKGGIVRASWTGGWNFESVPTWGGRIIPGSLVSGESRVFAINEFGKLVNTYPDAGVIKFGVIDGRTDLVASSLALGGSPKVNTGVYGVTTQGSLVRAFWSNGAWSFQTVSAASPIAPGSLISADQSVYGLTVEGKIVAGSVVGGVLKITSIGNATGLLPGSLAIAGPVKPFSDIYGSDSQGRLVRTFYRSSLATSNTSIAARSATSTSWVSAAIGGVTVASKSLVSGDDGIFGLDATGRPFAVTLANGVPTVVYPCPPPSPSAARLKAHAAVLRAFGIDNLAALGNLKLSGDVVPQSGLLRPRPDLTAGTLAIQAARRAVVVSSNTKAFVPLAVNGSLLKTEPFPAGKTSGLGDISIDTAYIAAQTLDLADDTHLILKFPNRHLVIVVETLTVGNNVTWTYERQPSAPAAKPGKPGKPGTPAVPNPFSKGNRGADGTVGTAGGKGWSFTGSPAPEVEIWVLNMTGSPAFDLRGQDGGAGVPGGDGGDGGNGSAGSPSKGNAITCNYGPGDGGDGGNGARAGNGGAGGDGAPGGRLTFYAPSPVLASYSSGFFLTVDGGSAGPGGIPGNPGAGGAGGSVGDVHGNACNKPAATRKAGQSGSQGAAAVQGPTGQAGSAQTPNPISFLPILPDDFFQAWDKPALESLTVPGPQAGKAFEGDVVSVKGQHFSSGDTLLIDNGSNWVPCVTQILGDTLLAFKVPAVPGGLHSIVLEQANTGTRSNAASLYILPKVDATQPGPRIRPGSTVTVQGSGFAPGIRVFVSGQESGALTYVDPHTLQLSVVRPKSFPEPPNADGDPADLSLALADGTLSNSIHVILDTYRIVGLGDSVTWGVGLQESQKFSALVAQRVKDLNQASNLGVSREVQAHTGAIIGITPSSQPVLLALPGEVSTSFPTIAQQLDLYAHDPTAAHVDLVLLDGCINDIGIFFILDPQHNPAQLQPLIASACHDDMLKLLNAAGTAFPQAKIIVNSYFAPLSNDSDPAATLLALFLAALDHPSVLLGSGQRAQIVANSLYFGAKSSEQLSLAVQDANVQLGGATPRFFFADPYFGSQNAALASSPWLFGINADGSAEDLLAGSRKTQCDQNSSRTDLVTCRHASVGHPNVTGAQQFANAIFPFL